MVPAFRFPGVYHSWFFDVVGQIYPSFMGGEYLPDADDGEVEIARVALRSVMADVMSVRACLEEDGIRYRIVDEYQNDITCEPEK